MVKFITSFDEHVQMDSGRVKKESRRWSNDSGKNFDRFTRPVAIVVTDGESSKHIAPWMRYAGISKSIVIYCDPRSEEHTSELQSLMRITYAVFCFNKKNINS